MNAQKRYHYFQRIFSTVAGLGLVLTPPAEALNIVLVETSTADAPPNDSDGALLAAMMEQAAQTWEALILDDVTVTIEFSYTNSLLAGGRYPWASAGSISLNGSNQPISGVISVNPFSELRPNGNAGPTWSFDANPKTHENFEMVQKLYRDLEVAEQDLRFETTGSNLPPDVLEVSYRGEAIAGTPAENTADAYTSLIHEIGHVLGLNSRTSTTGTTFFTTNGDFSAGSPIDVSYYRASDGDIEFGHLEWTNGTNTNSPLMCGSCAEQSARRLPTALDVISIASLGNWTEIDLPRKDFAHPNFESFNRARNWIGERVPGPGDEVFCRHGGLVRLTAAATMKTLEVGSQSRFETRGHDLTTTGDMTLKHPLNLLQRATLLIGEGSLVTTSDLDVGTLAIVELADDSDLVVNDDFILESTLRGNGKVRVNDLFRNNGGTIIAQNGGTLELIGSAAGIDLDGKLNDEEEETGEVLVESADLRLLSPLADHFGGTMAVEAGYAARFESTFILGTKGTIELNGGTIPDASGQATLIGRGEYLGQITVDGEAAIRSGNFVGVASSSDPSQLVGHTFETRSEIFLADAEDRLALYGVEVEVGATFTGLGTVVSGDRSELDLHDGVNVGVRFVNRGFLTIAAGSTGNAVVQELVCRNAGTMTFNIAGAPSSGDFDHLQSNEDAQLRGALEVDFDSLVTGLPGQRWRIIDAPGIRGVFAKLDITNVPPAFIASVEYASDGVDVVLSSKLTPDVLTNFIPISAEAGTGISLPIGQGGQSNVRFFSDNTSVLGALGDRLEFREAGTARVRAEVTQANGEVVAFTYDVAVTEDTVTCGVEAQLLDSFGDLDDAMGSSCAISGDVVISGAPEANGARGAAVVWERKTSGWAQVTKLIIAGAQGDRFGAAVAVDGTTAVVGAPGRSADDGVAQVYTRIGGTWSPSFILRPSSGMDVREFGHAVIVEGGFAIVGAPAESGGEGAVYVFERGAGVSWIPLVKLSASDAAADMRFGESLAWENGMLAVGAPGRNSSSGAVYRFEFAGGTLVERGILTAAGSTVGGERLGASVAIDPNNANIFAGAPDREVAGVSHAGGVAVFEEGSGWSFQTMIELPKPEVDDHFGFAIAVSDCGAIASAPESNAFKKSGGALHALINNGTGSWKSGGPMKAPGLVAGDQHGYSLAGDGVAYCSGARFDDDQRDDAGAVLVWRDGATGASNFIVQGDPADWLEVNFPEGVPGGNRFDLDDDGDGRTRLFEYLQGGSPTRTDDGGGTQIEARGGDRAMLRFRLARRAAQRFQILSEWTEDGVFWVENDRSPEIEDSGDPETVDLLWEIGDDASGRPPKAIGRIRVRPLIPVSSTEE